MKNIECMGRVVRIDGVVAADPTGTSAVIAGMLGLTPPDHVDQMDLADRMDEAPEIARIRGIVTSPVDGASLSNVERAAGGYRWGAALTDGMRRHGLRLPAYVAAAIAEAL